MEYPRGWTCEKTLVQLEYYLSSSLELTDALAVAEHLEACPGCAQRVVLFRMTYARTRRG